MNWSIFIIVALFIGVTYLFGLLYKIAEYFNRMYVLQSVGWKGFSILGFIGVPFHELAHLLMAVLFRYKITEVALYRPVKGKEDGVLGYVKYIQGGSLYQRMGGFFVGIAPMMFGAILLYTLMRMAFPEAFVNVVELPQTWTSLGEVLKGVFGGLAGLLTAIGNSLSAALGILLLGVLLCPHLGMSGADFKGTVTGMVFLLLAGLIIPFGLQLVVPSLTFETIYTTLAMFVVYYTYALLIGLLISTLSALFYRGLSLVVRQR